MATQAPPGVQLIFPTAESQHPVSKHDLFRHESYDDQASIRGRRVQKKIAGDIQGAEREPSSSSYLESPRRRRDHLPSNHSFH
ncbi:MAG TPA: hypothetical protein DDZ51_12260 [Planctomycetaceae bacterium]|nr:hypothetical protein [Planctomycetaceae bacterium]